MEDFRRFFQRGLATLLPTLITLLLLFKIWEILWSYLGQYIIRLLAWLTAKARGVGGIGYARWYWWEHLPEPLVQLIGVLLAILAVYIVGLFVGNIIGRTSWRLIEGAVMRIPLIRAIYPAVKQVTDFVLSERKTHLEGAHVVAVRPHHDNIWSVGLVTGPGIKTLSDAVGSEMVTVFVPSSPTAFSGYVLVVPRERVVELPLTVEDAMRLLVTGGVSQPSERQHLIPEGAPPAAAPAESAPPAGRAALPDPR
jgi:uncharacterized membrane protein